MVQNLLEHRCVAVPDKQHTGVRARPGDAARHLEMPIGATNDAPLANGSQSTRKVVCSRCGHNSSSCTCNGCKRAAGQTLHAANHCCAYGFLDD